MAEKTDPKATAAEPVQEPTEETPATRADETVPGGAYLVNGAWVDANGNAIAKPKARR